MNNIVALKGHSTSENGCAIEYLLNLVARVRAGEVIALSVVETDSNLNVTPVKPLKITRSALARSKIA